MLYFYGFVASIYIWRKWYPSIKCLVKINCLPSKFMVFLNSIHGCGRHKFGPYDFHLLVLLHSYYLVQFCHSVVSDSLQPHVHRQLPEFTQIHVHWVDDAIQPSHPLSSSSPPALSLSQHQGPFQWVGSLHQVVKVLELQLQLHPQSFQWIFRVDFL